MAIPAVAKVDEHKNFIVSETIRPCLIKRATFQIGDNFSSANFTNKKGGLPIEEFSIPPIKTRSGTTGTEGSKASSNLEQSWKQQAVLSFDGGGIRGYSSLIITKQIMKAVRDIEKQDEDVDSSFSPLEYIPPHSKRSTETTSNRSAAKENPEVDKDDLDRFLPCHYFDYIGGTSTGGLIAIMLGRLRMSVDECLAEYEHFGGEIFGHPRLFSMRGPLPAFREKYDGKRLQQAVQDVVDKRTSPEQKAVGAGYFGSAQELCKTIVVAYEWKTELKPSRSDKGRRHRIAINDTSKACPTDSGPYLFRSYNHWGKIDERNRCNVFERNPGPADNIPICQVARATAAAPTYFDPISIANKSFGDGGLGSNNPIQEMFLEVAGMHGNDGSVMNLVVSIGTGQAAEVQLHTSGHKKLLSYLNATKALATESEQKHRDMQRWIGVFSKTKGHYQRFNIPREQGLKNIKLDEWHKKGSLYFSGLKIKRRKESTLDKIRRITEAYCERPEVQKEIQEVAQKLVAHRKARSAYSAKWELWATGIRYRCTEQGCDKSQKLRPSKEALKRHIIKAHPSLFNGKTLEERREKLDEMIRQGTCAY